MPDSTPHTQATFVLDIIDKAVKLAAVVLGGIWTWWNYRKSRTYEQKLELEVVGTVFTRKALYGDVAVAVKNIGATKHAVQSTGTFCRLSVIHTNLEERTVRYFRVFGTNDRIEPGERINDTFCWRIDSLLENLLWIRLSLRVVSEGVEWNSSRLIRVDLSGNDSESYV